VRFGDWWPRGTTKVLIAASLALVLGLCVAGMDVRWIARRIVAGAPGPTMASTPTNRGSEVV
jgi:hypothetical protein